MLGSCIMVCVLCWVLVLWCVFCVGFLYYSVCFVLGSCIMVCVLC